LTNLQKQKDIMRTSDF